MSELVKRTATWMARAVREGEVSAVELLDAHAERIDRRNGEINAIVLPRLEAARAEAEAADAARSRGEPLGPLHGVPFTVKEVLDVAGMPTTNGSLLLADRVAREDSELVRRVRDAGAILLGKTNLSEFSGVLGLGQPRLRQDGQPARPHAERRGIVGRRGGGARGGDVAARDRVRPHGLDPRAGALDRRLRPALQPRRAAVRAAASAARHARDPDVRHLWPDGALGGRSRPAALRARRASCRRAARRPHRGLRGGRAAAGQPRLPGGGPPRRRGALGPRLRGGARTSRRGPPTCARPST